MSLGMGVFLSTAFIGILLLYRWTMGRWNWGRGLKRLLAGTATIVIVGGLSFWALLTYINRPTLQSRYYGVTVAMTMAEVKYKLGWPSNVLIPGDAGAKQWWERYPAVLSVKEIREGKSVDDYRSWNYDGSPRIDIEFDKAGGNVISVACFAGDASCAPLLGISERSTEKEVVDRLGEPTNERISGPTKTMEYRKLGVKLYLAKERVYMLEVREFPGS
ncbi:hypothetical protein QCE47_27130 [Caballeronia sp. LZ025]|uniref:hypothetical protein n=1 Tax=Caballeronia TaxID=1827195 RepID=UPI001FD20780|nr:MULTISPECIES: hypothetical protein [Caballeronia]MDR5735992.1 hypothetical protein [Caballeronia sp. LZ025]